MSLRAVGRSVRVVFAACLIGTGSTEAVAQIETPRRVSITVSGGVSLGAYQAGATWAFIYALRNHAALGAARDSVLPANRASLPPPRRYVLDVLTGASAGNINAVLAALEYCARRPPRRPEESLFWKAWIPIGVAELTADKVAGDELSAFSRRAAEKTWDSLAVRLASPDRAPTCELLLGITATKLTANNLRVANGIDVPVQRFAGVVRLVADTVGLTFALPRPADVVLPELTDILILDPAMRPGGDRVPRRLASGDAPLDLMRVRELVEASASFPIAFAPRSVSYQLLDDLNWRDQSQPPAPCVRHATTPARCADPRRERFVDGGVFDNRPLGLALSLMRAIERRGGVVQQGDSTRLPQRLIYFIDEDARRTDVPSPVHARSEPRSGLAAAMRVASNAFATSQNGELRLFASRITDAQVEGDHVSLGVNSRYPRLMAEHIGHFGAFLAPTFREHDFYAGVYDGLRSSLRELYCRADGVAGAAGPSGPTACETTWLRLVLDRRLVELRPEGQAVVERLFAHEERAALPELRDDADQRTKALVTLVEANVAARQPTAPRCRTTAFLMETPLCSQQLLTVIDAWRGLVGRDALCKGPRPDPAACAIVHDARAVYHRTAMTVLARMWRAEMELDRRGEEAYPNVIGVPLYGERSYNELFRSCGEPSPLGCVDPNPTTSDVLGGWWYAGAGHLLPVSVGAMRNGKAHWLEWRPTVYLARRRGFTVTVFAPIEAVRREQQARGAGGAGVAIMPPGTPITAISASWIGEAHSRPLLDVTAATLAGVVRVGIRAPPTGFGEFLSASNLTLGVGDANGLSARFVGWLGNTVRKWLF